MTRNPKRKNSLRAAREAMYRGHVLEVAEGLFAAQGFARTRMQEIASAAEVSLATVYQLFPGKQALFRQILIERDREMFRRVAADGAGVLDGSGGLEAVLRLMAIQVGYLLEHPDYLRLQLQEGRLWFHSDTRPSAAEQQLWEQGMALMRRLFEWGMGEGLFIPGDPEDLGRMLLALQQTRLANWVLGGMRAPQSEVIGLIQADFVRFFCQPAVATRYLKVSGEELADGTA